MDHVKRESHSRCQQKENEKLDYLSLYCLLKTRLQNLGTGQYAAPQFVGAPVLAPPTCSILMGA